MSEPTRAEPEPPVRLSETATEVLRQRYLRRDNNGAIVETPDGMFERVAAAVAQPAEQYGDDVGYWQARFYQRLRRLEFLPNSPTLMNAGLPNGQFGRLFRPAGGGRSRGDFRRPQPDGANSPERRRHRIFF